VKTVGIKDLKNNLSAYLREVRRGTRILVSDRGNVVAELHEPTGVYSTSDSPDPILGEWVRRREVILPRRKKSSLPESGVSLEKGTARRALDADRGDER
jgi:antitoxin (DNA-binding transcriptional repressor) of toxin-antitoxin stability system